MTAITEKEALQILNIENPEKLDNIFKTATKIREKYFKKNISACSIVNARCGGCIENCSFCAQSKRSKAVINYYPLISSEEMFKCAQEADDLGVERIGIVTSGRSVEFGSNELNTICQAIKQIRTHLKILPCASLGLLDEMALQALKDAGLQRYHNNLETCESYFSTICSTRNYNDQIDTIKTAQKIGLEICCGGIFGMGETNEQRVEMLSAIKSLNVESIPINFLTPIPGTLLENMNELTPLICLKIIATATLMMPGKAIRVCGGREYNLKDEQFRMFEAGVSSFMTGGYLVTPGRSIAEDMQMIKDSGLKFSRLGDSV
jgi:biotin synthase